MSLFQRATNAVLRVAFLLAALVLPRLGEAQDIEPRRWSHLPLGANFAGAGYAYTTGEISLDPALRIENAQFDMQTAGLKYIRSFELLGMSARVDLGQTYQVGHWTGLLNGVQASTDRSGLADTSVRFAVNLLGAPPLKGKEFVQYRATKVESETIVGLGLGLQLPTGQYYSEKLINLGDNRFTFRPQLGVVHNWGKWTAELTLQTWFYTDNNDFFRGGNLQQRALHTADANLIHTFRPGIWVAGSIGYAAGGYSIVNGVPNKDSQSTLGFGFSFGLPISHTVGVKLYYIGSRTQVSTGQNSDTFAAAVSMMW